MGARLQPNGTRPAAGHSIRSDRVEPGTRGYPVFVKPIYNFRGGGWRSGEIQSASQFQRVQRDAHGLFWTPVYRGAHRSVDLAVVDGRMDFAHSFTGYPTSGGMFDRWETSRLPNADRRRLERWVATELAGYTGMANVETIGGRIIEAHLRSGDLDLSGDPDVLQAMVDVYRAKPWGRVRVEPFAVLPLFGPHDGKYRLNRRALRPIREMALMCLVEDEPDQSLRAPGGRRLMVFSVPMADVADARAARDELARASGIRTPRSRP